MRIPVLTLITLIPLLTGIACLLLRRARPQSVKVMAFGASILNTLLTLVIAAGFSRENSFQFVEQFNWISSLKISYSLGVDGLGLTMLLLTAVVFPIALLAPFSGATATYYGLMLLLQAGVIGTFTALNFFHWFLFWELSLIPAFFLVKFYGGLRRDEASLNFFIQTMVGSIAMLLGFAALYLKTGTFDFYDLSALGVQNDNDSSPLLLIAFIGIFLGLAVKVPIFGLHTWLPVTYSEAPSSVTMVLTGVMSKMGVYGFLRILLPAFPGYLHCDLLLWLAVATILFSAFAALAQTDLKRILAYSSMNHLGYCLLAIFSAAKIEPGSEVHRAAAINGTILQMASHGLIASALFFCVALIERRSGGARDLQGFGGLRTLAPVFSGLMGIALFASLGLPGLSGFVAEFLMFKGIFGLVPWAAFLAAPGLLLTAIFTLRVFQGIFYGPVAPANSQWSDLSGAEKLTLIPGLVLILILGIYPQLLMQFVNPTTTAWTAVLK